MESFLDTLGQDAGNASRISTEQDGKIKRLEEDLRVVQTKSTITKFMTGLTNRRLSCFM
jgi:hypothetical protein